MNERDTKELVKSYMRECAALHDDVANLSKRLDACLAENERLKKELTLGCCPTNGHKCRCTSG